jgi:predicted acyltransferase (DUF342 family)
MNSNIEAVNGQHADNPQFVRSVTRIVGLALTITLLCGTATAGMIGDYAILAGHQVNFTSSMNVFNAPLARIGSNGDINFASAATIRTTNVEAAGSLLGNPSFLNVQNNLVFNGNVHFGGQSTVQGSADVGGTAIVNFNATVQGNLTATGDVTIGGKVSGNASSNGSLTLTTFGAVGHNVSANQNVVLGNSTSVGGNVTYGNQLTIGTFATIGGTQAHATTIVTPAHYTPVAIVPDSFTTGGADITANQFDTKIIAPGHYGNLSINAATIKLSPGQYFFDSVTATSSFMTLDLDLRQPGNLEIFVKGNYDIPLQVVDVNGVDVASVNPQLARRVFLESLGNIHIGWDNLGTLFAPTGDVNLDSLTEVWGATIAGHDAIFGGGADLQFVPSNLFVPEPSSLVLLTVGGVAFAVWRTRRRVARRIV